DFPSDFVLHVCEPSYPWYKGKSRAVSGVGSRIRQIREWRGLTLEALAAKCGIAKPNLSRLENDKVTPTFETLKAVAAALDTHPVMLITGDKQKDALTWSRHSYAQWKKALLDTEDSPIELVTAAKLVEVFLARWP